MTYNWTRNLITNRGVIRPATDNEPLRRINKLLNEQNEKRILKEQLADPWEELLDEHDTNK